MRNTIIAILILAGFAFSQTSNSTPKATAARPVTIKPAAAPTTKTTTTSQPITATFETTMGNINCMLFADKAPVTVANFIGLATGTKDWTNPASGVTMHHKPLYDGTVFHRVIPNFMIQGGDPLGNGSGGPGYSFKDEQSDLTFDVPGRLAMANSGPNTNGSQFFITEAPTPHLNGHYNIFGQCDDPELVKQIARAATDPRNNRPFNPVKITHVKIVDPNKPATHRTTGTTTHKSTTGTSTTKKATTPAHKPQ